MGNDPDHGQARRPLWPVTPSQYFAQFGTIAAAEKAFWRADEALHPDGLTLQAPSGELSAPADVASSVLTVLGVDTTPSIVRPAAGGPAPPEAGS